MAETPQTNIEPSPSMFSLSKRASKLAALRADTSLYYFPGVMKALGGTLWSEQSPDGYCVMAVAENRQTVDFLQERLRRADGLPKAAFYYDQMQGIAGMRAAVAGLLQRTTMKGLEVNPEDIVVQTGCGAILSNMFQLLCEPGESVLIPAPYYPAFENDMKAFADLLPTPVYLPEHGSVRDALVSASQRATLAGHPVTAILLTNPNNPLGTVYSPELLAEVIGWCIAAKVHLICDEVYAASMFGKDATFTSAAIVAADIAEKNPVDAESIKHLVHIVYGVSKDFCASGFRVGFLYSRNDGLSKSMGGVGYFSAVSNIVQHMLTEVFNDEAFMEEYFAENSRRLGAAYAEFTEALDKATIPYVPAVGAMSVWVDLRAALAEKTWESERKVWNDLVDGHKVVLTPGECCRAAEPGFFRACYAWMEAPGARKTTVERIAAYLQSLQHADTA